jgi:glycosyltransferase involved in cell wall biosynthesis
MVCNGWDTRKNPEPGLIAFQQLQQQYPTVQMHLYGADFGPGQTAEQWCTKQGIKQGLHFHGALPHHQLLQALNKHDVLLHTSIEESFGMVIAEAMALGLPVVAGESSGAVPWVVGTHGCLCDVKNVASIKTALLDALDTNRYRQLSQDGIEMVRQRFTTPAVVDLFVAQYESALAQAPSAHLLKGTQKVAS